ncbi:MAG: hypothetical protein FWG15_03820 [Propionibacteriaceae bacterium]|nr:hypothetical protein [Propionibacteriaceae bacterium]
MNDYSDLMTATRAVVDPSTTPTDLAHIAGIHPSGQQHDFPSPKMQGLITALASAIVVIATAITLVIVHPWQSSGRPGPELTIDQLAQMIWDPHSLLHTDSIIEEFPSANALAEKMRTNKRVDCEGIAGCQGVAELGRGNNLSQDYLAVGLFDTEENARKFILWQHERIQDDIEIDDSNMDARAPAQQTPTTVGLWYVAYGWGLYSYDHHEYPGENGSVEYAVLQYGNVVVVVDAVGPLSWNDIEKAAEQLKDDMIQASSH